MKLYSKSAQDGMYYPNIDIDEGLNIINRLRSSLQDKADRRTGQGLISVSDVEISDDRISMNVEYSRKQNLIIEKRCNITIYDEYFDKGDYISHINRQIFSFVQMFFKN